MTDPLLDLCPATLRSLASSLRDGPLSMGVCRSVVQQMVGPRATEICGRLDDLTRRHGMTAAQIAVAIDLVAGAQEKAGVAAPVFDLVLSGPDVTGIPTCDTAATFHSLVEEAEREVFMVGYAIHNGRRLFERLAERMQGSPELRVVLCLDIQRKYTDTSLSAQIVERFAVDFRKRHWPWETLPELYYDPRSLSESTQERSSLHAKCVVIDRRAALVTSANFTEAAQQRNIEVGVLVRHLPTADRLASYFEALIASGQLRKCRIA